MRSFAGMMDRRPSIIPPPQLLLRALLGILIGAAIPASATYPGKNGRIAFVAGPDIYSMNPDGSDVKELTNLGPDNGASWESWSPDGKQIAFNEYRAPDYVPQIWLMNADGSNQHALLATSDFRDERPSFSPDGRSVVFNRCRLDGEPCALYQIGLAGGTPSAITNFDVGSNDLSPQYAANGRLAFTGAGRRGIICAIYLKSEDGDGLRQLTPAPLSARQPDWSPDGNRIAISSHCGNPQNEEIWVTDLDRNELRQLTNNGSVYLAGSHDFHPSWSPQGDAIVFERQSPDRLSSAIYIIKLDGTGCRRLLPLPNPRHSQYARSGQIQNRLRSAASHGDPTQIEAGGALPQWGVASN
jgi:Tol biopolymer transport system component